MLQADLIKCVLKGTHLKKQNIELCPIQTPEYIWKESQFLVLREPWCCCDRKKNEQHVRKASHYGSKQQ